jgi:hypothetical protein
MQRLIHPIDVEVVGPHKLRLRFADDAEGEIDFAGLGWTGVFAPLEDPEYFASVRIDPAIKTIAWPNHADIAPETLYRWATEGTRPSADS